MTKITKENSVFANHHSDFDLGIETPAASVAASAPAPAPAPIPAPTSGLRPTSRLYTPPVITRASGVYVPSKVPEGPTPPKLAMTQDNLLQNILSYRRAHGSAGEKLFHAALKALLEHMRDDCDLLVEDKFGNLIMTVNDRARPQYRSRTMFSCHIDTCHSSSDTLTQYVSVVGTSGPNNVVRRTLKLAPASAVPGNCLGADDGVGVYLMLRMIEAGVCGTYVFHRAEEVGCRGSKWIVSNAPQFLKQFDVAIAFDRPNCTEVITHQRGQRCASDETGKVLCDALNTNPTLNFVNSPRGVYTDTAEYAGIISECFNLGVGYTGQHSQYETADLNHIEALEGALLNTDWDTLKPVRDPNAKSVYHMGHHQQPLQFQSKKSMPHTKKPEPDVPDAPASDNSSDYVYALLSCESDDDFTDLATDLAFDTDPVEFLRAIRDSLVAVTSENVRIKRKMSMLSVKNKAFDSVLRAYDRHFQEID